MLTYGLSPQADFRATAIEAGADGSRFDVEVADRTTGSHRTLSGLVLPMVGTHNVLNALAAIAIAIEMGIDDETVRTALAGFAGVKRRFTKVGRGRRHRGDRRLRSPPGWKSRPCSTPRGRAAAGHVIAVVQPHRYSRLAHLFDDFCTCFNDADIVVVADVYAAGEDPIEGVDRDALAAGLRARGHRDVRLLDSPDALAPLIAGLAGAGDVVLCLGAGSITGWASSLPGRLAGLLGAAANEGAGHG